MIEEVLLIIGFSLLVLRSVYWVFSVWEKRNPGWKVFLGQLGELCLVLFIFSQLARSRILPMPYTISSSFLGFLLVSLGVWMSFMGKHELGKNWWYAGGYKKPSKLIITGIYRYLRHPIYLGFVLSFVGMEITLGSYLWISFLGLFIPAYFQAKKEERLLENHFGKIYKEYQKKTKMFVPFIF